MNKQLLIFTVMLIFWFGCKRQKSSNYPEYYKLYNKVLKLEKADRIEEAFQLFQEAEKLVEFIPVQHLLSARSYAYKLQDCKLTL